ncbi:MAG: TonB-dependent receptor [Bacteroidota bacterium]|nr:TonB-dependent receptor [Bacteroidota bacterium]
MKSFFSSIALFMLLACAAPIAQAASIKGILLSSDNKSPLPFALISCTPGVSQYADLNGQFTFSGLTAGQYSLSVSLMGYEKLDTLIILKGDEEVVDLGSLSLSSSNIQMPEVIISHSLYNYNNRYVGSNAVISKQDLERVQPLGSEEALKKVAGVNVSGDMGISNRLNVGIRGSYPRRSGNIMLLEDGVPIAPAPYLAPEAYYNPPSDRLDGIEIIKGADIVTLGGNSSYGAINYITKRPPLKPTVSLSLVGGANGYNSQFLTYGGTWNNVAAEFQVLNKSFDGFQDNSQSDIFNTTAKVYADLGTKTSVYMKINYHQENSKATYSALTPYTFNKDPRQNPFDSDDLMSKRYAADFGINRKLGKSAWLTSKLYASQFTRDWWRQENTLVLASNVKNYVGESIYNNHYSYLDGETFGSNDWVRVGKIAFGNESTKARNRTFKVAGVQETFNYEWKAGEVEGRLEIGARGHWEVFNNIEIKNDSSRFSRSGKIEKDEKFILGAYSAFVKNTFRYKRITFAPAVRFETVTMRKFDLKAIALDPNNDGSRNYKSVPNTFTSFVPGATFAYAILDNEKHNMSLYAGAYRGYTAPTSEAGFLNVEDEVVSAAATNDDVNMKPETSFNYEGGVRGTLAKDLVFGQAAYFNNTITNFYSAGRNEAFQSLGSVNISGVEVAGSLNLHKLYKNEKHKLVLGFSTTFMQGKVLSGRLKDSDLLNAKHTDATKQELIDKINTERNGYDVYFASSTGSDSLVTRELTTSDFSSVKRLDLKFGEDGISSNTVPYLPGTMFNVGLAYSFRGLTISTNYNYIGSQYTDYLNMNNETAEGAIGKLDAFSTIDATVSYSFNYSAKPWLKGCSFFVAGKNLTNEVYKASRLHRFSSGIMPGGFRQVNAGIKFSF